MTLPPWLQALQSSSPGETPGQHVARIVRAVAGCSLVHEAGKLAELFLINEPSPEQARRVSAYATNCATFARQVYALAGCDHMLITRPYKIGTAMSWVLTAARAKGALLPPSRWREAGPGWGLWYGTPAAKGKAPRNDDHLETCLAVPDAEGVALHGGGGRSKNAITLAGPNNIRWSSGRPLRGLIDPGKMVG